MDYLLAHRAEIEIVYFIASSAMTIALVLGLVQLFYLKKDLEVKYKREAIKESLAIVSGFISRANDMAVRLMQKQEEESMPKKPDIKFKDFWSSEFPPGDPWLSWFRKSNQAYLLSINLLNELDHFAVVMLSGLADEGFTYQMEGIFFIEHVESIKHYLAANREGTNKECASSLIKLYQMWTARRARENLVMEHQKTATELKRIPIVPKVSLIGE
jgi:hypothetical protein